MERPPPPSCAKCFISIEFGREMIRELTGITWDHSRALPPLVAAAQRYEETRPGVRIRWEKRSLHEFGHMSVDVLAERFDLVVIDHPWAGFAFARSLFLDLNEYLPRETVAELDKHSIGASLASYCYEGKLLAVPIDAAAPTPSWRPDLLERAEAVPPASWRELIELSRRGLVMMPGWSADLYLNFHMLCEALGGRCFADRERLVDRETGLAALELLRELADGMPKSIFDLNPIRLAEEMITSDEYAYCPFAYSYGNYSRPFFGRCPLRYGELVKLDDGRPLRSVIGGTGIAISRNCKEIDLAIDYVLFTASAEVQRGIYTLAGGQPSRVEAWEDSKLDEVCGGFFSGAGKAQREAIIRPRYDGYVPLQEAGGNALIYCLRDGKDSSATLDELDAAYRNSLPSGPLPRM